MIITDYLRAEKDDTWDVAKQCGVEYATIRLPETADFDVTDKSHWESVYNRYKSAGFTPLVLEPMPNALHDHIKAGDEKRDECIDKVIRMLPIMDKLGIRTICFNFMAYLGWCRTGDAYPERGGAEVTGFNIKDFRPLKEKISEEELWNNYSFFIKAVIPYAEKYGIRLALHPDDPPLAKMGDISRIMISTENIEKAVRNIVSSDFLGVTMCQANFYEMGENLFETIPRLADKIFFIHFRNVSGSINDFRETFHDNGDLPMAKLMRLYTSLGINVPIRVDHVPSLPCDTQGSMGYKAMGRHFAIGYMKGIIEACNAYDQK
ncbi:MAG: mannonate dehydratase [Eubacteriales bacterium]|nr:mannonate dehydratase [Eubacteriales bacterium]